MDDPLARQEAVEDRAGKFNAGGRPGEAKGAKLARPGGNKPGKDTSRISASYEPVQPTYAQQASRVKAPDLAVMGPGTDRVLPKVKPGAYGENIRGPHRPTLDEMGPHAEQPLPVSAAKPSRPARTIEVDDPAKTKTRRGRPRKTGRPGA
jgi:excinuclease ABC subunit B